MLSKQSQLDAPFDEVLDYWSEVYESSVFVNWFEYRTAHQYLEDFKRWLEEGTTNGQSGSNA